MFIRLETWDGLQSSHPEREAKTLTHYWRFVFTELVFFIFFCTKKEREKEKGSDGNDRKN